MQLVGMLGLVRTARRTLVWCWHLYRGNIVRHTEVPTSRFARRGVEGGRSRSRTAGQTSRGALASQPSSPRPIGEQYSAARKSQGYKTVTGIHGEGSTRTGFQNPLWCRILRNMRIPCHPLVAEVPSGRQRFKWLDFHQFHHHE